MAACLHAAGVRGLRLLVVLVNVVETVERSAYGPDETTDRGPFARALAAACYRAAGRPDRCTANASDGDVLHHFDRFVALARRRRCVLVAGVYYRLRRDR